MYFTQEDYRKIEKWLLANSKKDTQFVEAATPLQGNETIAFVQNGKNVKTSVKDIVDQLFLLGVSDFLNITDKYGEKNITINQAIQLIPFRSRKIGQVITFLDEDGNWRIYQFKGNIHQWNMTSLWEDILDFDKYVINSILPDEEDLTKSLPDTNGNSYLKFKDKEYDPDNYSGLGRVYLRKNIVEVEDPDNPICGKITKNLLYQDMIDKPNTIYIIQYDYDLNGQEIEIPENCVLKFQGGSLRNGIVILNGTSLMEDGSRIFDNITLSGILNGDLSCTMFGASPSSSKDLNLNSIKETIKQLDNVGGGELLIPQEINYGYERNTPSTWVYTTVSNNIIVKDESKGNTYNLPSRDGSQIRNFFMTEGNPMDGNHDGGGFMVRANWHPYMMLSNDRDPVEANNRRATYFVGNNGKICWGIGQGSNTIEPDGTDRDDALSNFKIVGNGIAGGNGLTNMMVINKTNAFFGFNLSTPVQDYHFNFRNVEGRDNANVHFDASLRSGTLEILLTAGEAKKRIGVSPITNNLYFASDNSIVTSITRNGDILLKGDLGLFTGEGDPNGVFSCGIGALYQNRTARANGKGLYVCTDAPNKKFNLVSGVDSCTSTSRPSTTELPVGFPTFDTTLGKPIWWTGNKWVDATGAQI